MIVFTVSAVLSALTVPWLGPVSAGEVTFTEAYLNNPDNIALGKKIWFKRCKFCHGKTAYPGKAPKLQPSRYTSEFVYDRVTNGFGGMPSWKHEFSEQERRAVVAYILSKEFSN
ncbi:MAG: c-type cytochrome [Acidiferrobacterales bacterium]